MKYVLCSLWLFAILTISSTAQASDFQELCLDVCDNFQGIPENPEDPPGINCSEYMPAFVNGEIPNTPINWQIAHSCCFDAVNFCEDLNCPEHGVACGGISVESPPQIVWDEEGIHRFRRISCFGGEIFNYCAGTRPILPYPYPPPSPHSVARFTIAGEKSSFSPADFFGLERFELATETSQWQTFRKVLR